MNMNMETHGTVEAAGLPALIHEAASVKAQIATLQERLKDLNSSITEQVSFPAGKQTASVTAGNITCRVQLADRYKWDQDKLHAARVNMGDALFLRLFRYTWEPVSKRTVDTFLATCPDDQRSLLRNALTITRSVTVNFKDTTGGDHEL